MASNPVTFTRAVASASDVYCQTNKLVASKEYVDTQLTTVGAKLPICTERWSFNANSSSLGIFNPGNSTQNASFTTRATNAPTLFATEADGSTIVLVKPSVAGIYTITIAYTVFDMTKLPFITISDLGARPNRVESRRLAASVVTQTTYPTYLTWTGYLPANTRVSGLTYQAQVDYIGLLKANDYIECTLLSYV